jgi:DNA repair exonuclease SbcCD nuclease subunit
MSTSESQPSLPEPSPGEFKFVHAADLHLDSPLRGLQRYEGAPVAELRGATRRATENLVQLCLDEQVAFLLIAGDLFDGDWKDYGTGLFFVKQMKRLKDGDVRVFIVRGNHDAQSKMSHKLRLPDNVHLFAARSPETIHLEALGVAIHGQSYAQRDTQDDLSAGYPAAVSGALNIGVLHTSLDGREGHANYAPCTTGGLLSKGYDYWALGHVHKREVVSSDPWIVFPGNLQGRHARELGPKGASLVTVVDQDITEVKHCSLDVVRWVDCPVDVTGQSDGEAVLDCVERALQDEVAKHDDRLIAARVTITGCTEAHGELLRAVGHYQGEVRGRAIDLGDDCLWIEKVRLRTTADFDVEALRDGDGPYAELLRSTAALAGDEQAVAALATSLSELVKKVDSAVLGPDEPRADTVEEVQGLLGELDQLLIARLWEAR